MTKTEFHNKMRSVLEYARNVSDVFLAKKAEIIAEVTPYDRELARLAQAELDATRALQLYVLSRADEIDRLPHEK